MDAEYGYHSCAIEDQRFADVYRCNRDDRTIPIQPQSVLAHEQCLSVPRISQSPEIETLYQSIPLQGANREIRLLTIAPALHESDPIECTLFKASLNKDNPFIALSYVWGSLDDPITIALNGTDFNITRNLDYALRNLRMHRPNATFWINAICINQVQTAKAEQEQQVEIMDLIYETALQIMACLGPAPAGHAEMLAAIDTSMFDSENWKNSTIHEGQLEDEQFVQKIFHEDAREAFNLLFQKPYWSRTWTLQEITLASEALIVYGRIIIPWKTFDGLISFWIARAFSGLSYL